jgi:hypothetical protein
MLRCRFRFAAPLALLALVVAACSDSGTPDRGDDDDDGGNGGSNSAGAGGSTAGSNTQKAGTGPAGASGSTTAGSGGNSSGAGGSNPAGSGGSNPAGSGGTNPAGGGGTGPGGAGGSAGGGGNSGSGPDVDQEGKMNATPGSMTSTPQDYLRLGEIRILNNNWGSEELGCDAMMSVFVDQSRNIGWNFNRGNCDTANTNSKPDFPQIEFGIHPFGIGDSRVTSPEFSSTTLLPIQIKNVQSASVNISNLTATFQQESSWNITFEFWISERNPLEPNPGVYAELMTFWGWQDGRWPSPPNGMGPMGNGAGNQVSSGGKTYTLWVQDDAWASGQWRYFQFRDDGGPQKNFNGTLDVKPFLDYLVNSRQYSPEFWISRLEVGSEIDDDTQGTVQMSNISFEVNGQTRAAVIGP